MLPPSLKLTLEHRLCCDLDVNELVSSTKRLLCNHVEYISRCYVVVHVVEEEEIPVWLKIKYILCFEKHVGYKWETLQLVH